MPGYTETIGYPWHK